jgi:hypothetical protein
MDPIVYILLSFASLLITLLIARWVFNISTIIKYQRAQLFLLKRIAEKSEALNDEQRKWIDEQMK